jgi:hypothetical protein
VGSRKSHLLDDVLSGYLPSMSLFFGIAALAALGIPGYDPFLGIPIGIIVAVIPSSLALYLGIEAKDRVQAESDRKRGRRAATVGIILEGIAIIPACFVALIFILAAVFVITDAV